MTINVSKVFTLLKTDEGAQEKAIAIIIPVCVRRTPTAYCVHIHENSLGLFCYLILRGANAHLETNGVVLRVTKA